MTMIIGSSRHSVDRSQRCSDTAYCCAKDSLAQDELFYILQNLRYPPPDIHVHITPVLSHLSLGLNSNLYKTTRLIVWL